MSKILIFFFSIPVALYLSLFISHKFFSNQKKAFYILFYVILLSFSLVLGTALFFSNHPDLLYVPSIRKIIAIPVLLFFGLGYVLGVMSFIKPLKFAEFLKENKKVFFFSWGAWMIFAILERFL